MKKKSLLKLLLIYGIAIPFAVAVLAIFGIILSCNFYWGTSYLSGKSGFTLQIMYFSLLFSLTLIYYGYCIFHRFVKNLLARQITLLFVLFVPVWYFNSGSDYDYRITISFALFHFSYYALLFLARNALKRRQ